MTRLRFSAASILAAALLALPGVAAAATAHPATPAYSVGAALSTTGQGLKAKIHLKITLNGATALDAVVSSRACPPGCTTVGLGTSHAPLRAVALQAFGPPDVVLGLYSGGAHCCFVDQVYRLDTASGRFTKIEHDFADAGAQIVDLNHDRNFEFLSADARISNAGFTDFADSPAPLQIWSVTGNRFHDVTDHYPALLRKDAAKQLRDFHRHMHNGRGRIAAWAADEYRLGRQRLVATELAGALKAGHLGVPQSFGGPRATTFVTQLPKLLRRLGY
jgi:hypothetical protein